MLFGRILDDCAIGNWKPVLNGSNISPISARFDDKRWRVISQIHEMLFRLTRAYEQLTLLYDKSE